MLITGESGTGKELIARAIHRNSAVVGGPFVKVNCAAIPPELIESELFGHERGAFTGAVAKKRGLFEVADGGTIFLDEIGDMALPAQAKVLRVLQTGEFTRVGGEKSLRTDCRVVAATNRDLEQMVKDGTFREDLYFRLNVVPIRSPDLKRARRRHPAARRVVRARVLRRERPRLQAGRRAGARAAQAVRLAGQRARAAQRRRAARDHERRGDPREGPAAVPRRAARRRRSARRQTGPQTAIDLGRYAGKSLREFREEVESEFIRIRLAEFEWNISRTAQALGIERTNLHKKLRALGIHRGEGGGGGDE